MLEIVRVWAKQEERAICPPDGAQESGASIKKWDQRSPLFSSSEACSFFIWSPLRKGRQPASSSTFQLLLLTTETEARPRHKHLDYIHGWLASTATIYSLSRPVALSVLLVVRIAFEFSFNHKACWEKIETNTWRHRMIFSLISAGHLRKCAVSLNSTGSHRESPVGVMLFWQLSGIIWARLKGALLILVRRVPIAPSLFKPRCSLYFHRPKEAAPNCSSLQLSSKKFLFFKKASCSLQTRLALQCRCFCHLPLPTVKEMGKIPKIHEANWA